jgi:outer membrane protein assembly factor BamA
LTVTKRFGAAVSGLGLALALCPRARAEDGLGMQRDVSDTIPGLHLESATSARDDEWGVLPELGYSPDQKLNGGAKFTAREVTPYRLTLDGEVNVAMERQTGVDATVLAPHLQGGKGIDLNEYHFYESPNTYFFGLGDNHVSSPEAVYEIRRQRALATYGYRLTRHLVVAGTAGIRQTLISQPQSTAQGPSLIDAFPRLRGIGGGRTNPVVASLVYNDRESITHPTRGWSVIGAVEHVNRNLGNDYNFTRFTLDSSYLHPLPTGPHDVFGLRMEGETIAGRTATIPFFELASLGGSDNMRGFYPDRFLGRSMFVVNAENRVRLVRFNFFDIWDVRIAGVAFFDVGRVFISDAQDSQTFRLRYAQLPSLVDEFRYSYGPGLRIELGDALVARIDAGFSNEQVGLVYLVFGHTF